MAELVSDQAIWRGDFLSLSEQTWKLETDDEITRVVVHHPGAVVVLPLTVDGQVIAVSQFRASVGEELLELCAGKRDVEGESPLSTAKRELAEELGLSASDWIQLPVFRNSPGFSDELSYLFLARGLSVLGRSPQSVEEQQSSLKSFALDAGYELISRGSIQDAKTIIGIMYVAAFLEREVGRTQFTDQPDLIETIGAERI